jgi:cytidine deaminase
MVKLGETERKLLDSALKGMQAAYVLWGFRVGAAVLGKDGQIYEGCNIESWISGLGICAERCAIDHAVLHGNRKIREMAIVIDSEHKNELRPCGACLQYIYDFAEKPRIKIVTAKAENNKLLFETVQAKTLEELLLSPFKK